MTTRTRAALAAFALGLAAGAAAQPGAGPGAEAGAPRPERPLVRDVVLELPPGEDAAAIRGLVAVKVGQPLSPRAVRRTVERLYGLGRFANVEARTRPAGQAAPGQVVLVLECQPRTTVVELRVVNRARSPALDEERVRRAAGLAPGDELWKERLEEAAARVRAAYARRGYRGAQVQSTISGEHQVVVQLLVEEGAPTRVAGLVLKPAGGDLPAGLGDGLSTRAGAVLDLDALEADLGTLRARLRRDGYLRARVGAPAVAADGERASVTVEIDPGLRVEFRFPGAAAFSPAELRAQLGLEAEQGLDGPAIAAAAARLRAFYVAHGYAAATVAGAELPARAATVVAFRVDEGRPYHVRSVRFPGAKQRTERWLRARLEEALELAAPREEGGPEADAERLAKAAGSPAPVRSRAAVLARDAWNAPAWDQAALRLVELYRADGYLDAAHEGTRALLDAREGAVDVEIRLREGVRTLVESVEFEGNRVLSAAELQRDRRLAPGDPLAFGAVEATRAAALARYARQGYLYARVHDVEEFSPDRQRARVRFQIEEGPQVKLGKVVVSGARRTRESVVRNALGLREGDVYDPEAAARSQAALLRLGVFRSVGVRLSRADEVEAVKDLHVELAERPWQTLAPGVGFSLANGPRAFVEFVRPNLFGRALELTARAKVNYPLGNIRPDLSGKPFLQRVEGRADVGIRDPRLRILGQPVGARLDLIAERLHRRAFDLGRTSAVFGLEMPASDRLTLALQYELEYDHMLKSALLAGFTRADIEQRRLPEGFTTLQSLRPSVTLDLRDNALNPRSGLLTTVTADYAHSIGVGNALFTHMLKLSGVMSGYVPLGSQAVLALSLRGGRVFSLESRSQTIGPKRFFLGGATTMRGYGEDEMIPEDVRSTYLDQVRACKSSLSGLACSSVATQLAQGQTLVSEGGELFVLGKAELRFPLLRSVEAGLFADVGNLWLDPGHASLANLRLNLGLGLRFASPVGPVVFDLGFNVAPDGRLNESVVAPHFSIGVF